LKHLDLYFAMGPISYINHAKSDILKLASDVNLP